MSPSNGHDSIIPEPAPSPVREPTPVIERVPDNGEKPFEQHAHDLMTESVDRIAQQWVGELSRVRDNTLMIEQMVLAQATRVKSELTRMHLLGVKAMQEAKRGHEVGQHLVDELDQMMADHHVQTHG